MDHEQIEREAEQEGLAPLPARAAELLAAVKAPPRLTAHHILVHDVACQLLDGLDPLATAVDIDAVKLGAATHDIGKALVPAELSGPGKRHEAEGHEWLRRQGVPEHLARFARTHGLPVSDPAHRLEDLAVILADKVWKGKRVTDLEERIARELEAISSLDFFELLLGITDLADRIAETADWRLAWQNRHPIEPGQLIE